MSLHTLLRSNDLNIESRSIITKDRIYSMKELNPIKNFFSYTYVLNDAADGNPCVKPTYDDVTGVKQGNKSIFITRDVAIDNVAAANNPAQAPTRYLNGNAFTDPAVAGKLRIDLYRIGNIVHGQLSALNGLVNAAATIPLVFLFYHYWNSAARANDSLFIPFLPSFQRVGAVILKSGTNQVAGKAIIENKSNALFISLNLADNTDLVSTADNDSGLAGEGQRIGEAEQFVPGSITFSYVV